MPGWILLFSKGEFQEAWSIMSPQPLICWLHSRYPTLPVLEASLPTSARPKTAESNCPCRRSILTKAVLDGLQIFLSPEIGKRSWNWLQGMILGQGDS